METSLFLAKVLGPYLIIVSIAGLVNQKLLGKTMKMFAKHVPILFISGAMALIIGLLMVASHNIWTKDWRVIITVFGWLAVLKGVLYLILPADFARFAVKAYSALAPVGMIIALIAGIYLTKVAFTS